MYNEYSKSVLSNAKTLRKNMTKEERHLWYDFLRSYNPKFLRQKIFGCYILDFYCARAKLVVELDGSQHYLEKGENYDKERTQYLESFGLLVLRFPNNMVFDNFRGVCEQIDLIVKERSLLNKELA